MRPIADIFPIAGTLLFLAGTGILLWRDAGLAREPQRTGGLQLQAVEQDGRIRLDWDPSDPAIRNVKSAKLVARDGAASHEYPVSGEALQGGGLDYLRRTNDVLLTLRLDGRPTESAIRTIVVPKVPARPAGTVTETVSRARAR